MTRYINVEGDGAAACAQLSTLLESYAARLSQRRSVWVLTGGSSLKFWGETALKVLAETPNAAIALTDTFLRSEALAQGRKDTNERTLLEDAGLAKAIGDQSISPSRLILPDFSQGDHQAIARDLNRRIWDWRGEPSFDVVLASSGGGTYNAAGDVDPGHVFGLPHGQPQLFEDEGPYVVAHDMLKAPSTRITLNGRGIKRMVLFCLGEKKANAAENIRRELSPVDCPACLVHQVEEGTVVFG